MTTTDLTLKLQHDIEAVASECGLKHIPTPEQWVDFWKDPVGKAWIHAMKELHNNAIKSVTEETTNLISE